MKPEQITAWALDEASAEERQQLEAALQENPQDKVKADETKAFCDFLLSELRDDSLALTDKQRERLVAQSSRLPAASGTPASATPAQTPASGGKSGQTTRWNIGVIVRLSLAACAVLGGFWTWQAYSSRRGEARAVAAVAEKPGIKVQLAKPEAKKSTAPGPEARLLAGTQKKAAVSLEPTVSPLPTPAPVAGAAPAASPLALNNSQSAMTPGDVSRLKQIQDQNAYALNFGGMEGLSSSGVDLSGTAISKAAPFKYPELAATVSGDLGPASVSFGYSFLHNMGALANGGGFNSFSGGHGDYGMNDIQQLTLGVNTNLGPVNLASSTNYDLVNGGWHYDLHDRATIARTDAVALPPLPADANASTVTTASGTMSQTKTGAGTLTLAASNSYSGTTTINGGTLSVSSGAAMPRGDAFAPMMDDLGAMKRNAGASLNFNGGIVATGATAAPAAGPASVLVSGNRGLAVKDDKNIGGLGAIAPPVQNPPAGAVDANVSSATTAPQAAAVDKVQSGLMLGNNAVESGNYDDAIAQYQNVLRTDPYNQAARRGMEAADKKRQAYFKTAYDNQRSKMLAQITETWEDKGPTLAATGDLTMGKDVKTDDFYLGKTAMPEERKAERPAQPSAGESYTRIIENEMKEVAREPLSTLSIDVDTASYANVRRFLNQNMLPPPDAVRIEELVNYFPTSEEGPAHEAKQPFGVRVELAPCPWQPVHRLARISIKGREMDKNRKASNLVFLVDVSGSMDEPAKLPLVQQSLRMLTEHLGEGDHVTMVVYAGSSGVVLPPTSGEKKEEILAAINRLSAGGSTHGSAGIQLAYEQAVAGFIKGGVNRVILCTDGDFNVGVSSPEELEKLIKHKAKTGVFLSVLGFGSGNLKDRTMETLADKGNGNYAYIDSLSEARKVLVEQMSGTLDTIAKDVKIQVEFNPAAVRSYRLIGYENRVMAKEDFNDDTKDAGEIGAGHSVVALYEVVPANLPAGAEGRPAVDSLKYQAPAISPAQLAEAAKSGELMTVKLRYKEPESDLSKLIEVPTKDEGKTLTASSEEFKFSAAVAGFGLLLRDSSYKGSLSWETVRRLALDGKGADKLGYRGEFLQLIDKARGLKETR